MFALQNAPRGVLDVRGLTLTPELLDFGMATFDLTFLVSEEAGEFVGSFTFDTDLFTYAYAEQMLTVCNANPELESLSREGTFVPRPEFRPPTRFERRGERLGHGVWDLAYAKTP